MYKYQNKLNFRISLDGADAETNDKIRGHRAFERAERGIKNVIDFIFRNSNSIINYANDYTFII